MSRLDIQQLDFDWMDPDTGYVMISMAVGKSPLPKTAVHDMVMGFQRRSNLCKLLDKLEITYDVVPCRVDSFNGSQIQVENADMYKGNTEEIGTCTYPAEVKIADNPFSDTLKVYKTEPEPDYEDAQSEMGMKSDDACLYASIGKGKTLWSEPVVTAPYNPFQDRELNGLTDLPIKGIEKEKELKWRTSCFKGFFDEGHRDKKPPTIGDPKFNARKLTESEKEINMAMLDKAIEDIYNLD